MEIVLLLIGVVVGVAVGWLLREGGVSRLNNEVTRARDAVEQAQQEAVRIQAAAEESSADAAERAAQLAQAHQEAIVARILTDEANARSQVQADLAAALAQVDNLRAALETAHAQHLAKEREHQRQVSGQTQVLERLAPVAEQLATMRQRVESIEKQRHEQHGELAEQLRSTQTSVAESRKAADKLTHALSNNAVRGFWGETQLRTLVESAGLISRVDFDLQRSIDSDSGARRPDMVVNLPGGKHMAIDAKAPYNSYIEACNKDLAPDQQHLLLVEHAKRVRSHIDALASKSYWSGLAASPEFTIAFIPNDQLLAAALETDPSLLEHAFSKGVVLATPANLWAILKTVAFTWRQDVLTEDAKELFDLGRELYRRIQTMAEHAEKLRRSLESTIKSYNAFAGSLETRVLVTARKLDRMDESAVIPSPTHIDIAPKALTSGDFEAIAGDEREELMFDLEPVEAEIVDARDAV